MSDIENRRIKNKITYPSIDDLHQGRPKLQSVSQHLDDQVSLTQQFHDTLYPEDGFLYGLVPTCL